MVLITSFVENESLSKVATRLRFIDVARSVAIIMMLQGHFIARILVDYDERRSQLGIISSPSDVFFAIWFHFRGLTAPLFFTITGVVFVYLLLGGDKEQSFFKQKRVRKGFKRAFVIISLGYLLQLNYQNINYYLSGRINDRFFGFHVLQSIGTGILILLVLYGLFLSFRLKRFSVLLIISGVAVFAATSFIRAYGNVYLPQNFPVIIQNAIHGPNSFFPLFPWLGYVLFGGAIGAILREFSGSVRNRFFPLKFFIGYVIFGVAFISLLLFLRLFTPEEINFGGVFYSCFRLGEVVLFLAILMYFERFSKGGDNAFIRMGQNTLPIYVWHVILLYGAITGVGLQTYYGHSLSFGATILGAVLFVLAFALLANYIDRIKAFFSRIFNAMKAPFLKTK